MSTPDTTGWGDTGWGDVTPAKPASGGTGDPFTVAGQSALRCMIYGKGGMGKSSAWALLHRQRDDLVVRGISTEGGELPGTMTTTPDTFVGMLDIIDRITSGAIPTDVLVIDTLTAAQDMAKVDVMQARGITDMEGVDFKKAWIGLVQRMDDLRTALDRAWRAGIHIVLIAHLAADREANVVSSDYLANVPDLYHGESKVGSVRRAYFNWCSCVLALDESVDVQRGKVKSVGQRGFHTQAQPHMWAKNRNSLPAWVPFAGPNASGEFPHLALWDMLIPKEGA